MKGLYLILDLATLLCPVILSFDKRVQYIRSWKNVMLASSIIAIPFLIWDAIFTQEGVWGFNPDYLVGFSIFGLPIEEILFFWVVPFACVFIYECCKYYFRNVQWRWFNLAIQIGIFIYLVYLSSQNPSGWYTLSAILSSVLVVYIWITTKGLPFLGIAYVLCLIPFLIVNGVLTGSWIEAPIVWYNSTHFSDIRIGTIPMEDAMYGFSLIAGNIILHEAIRKWKNRKFSLTNQTRSK